MQTTPGKNFFAQGIGPNLQTSTEADGGDFFTLDGENIVPAAHPSFHPFFSQDENGNIELKEPWRFSTEYLSLITPLYRNKPLFMRWLETTLAKIPNPVQLVDLITTAFELDSAVGVQLDILGQVAGRERTVDFSFSDGSSSVLDDDSYRVAIKAKIAKNLWDGKTNSLVPIWQTLFPDLTLMIHDNQDMTMNVYAMGSAPLVIKELITHGYIVPKPQGVRINMTAFIGLPAFGFGMDDEYVSGFDRGHWVMPEATTPLFGFDRSDDEVAGFDAGGWLVTNSEESPINRTILFGFGADDDTISGFDIGTWA